MPAARYDAWVRRFRRILINTLTILSLLLCVGTCVLWVRNFSQTGFVEFTVIGRSYRLRSQDGSLAIGNEHVLKNWQHELLLRRAAAAESGVYPEELDEIASMMHADNSSIEMQANLQTRVRDYRERAERMETAAAIAVMPLAQPVVVSAAVPYPVPIVMAAILPALWVARWRFGTHCWWLVRIANGLLIWCPSFLVVSIRPPRPSWTFCYVVSAFVATWYFVAKPLLVHQWRKQAGECAACGYDLRASPKRCPECGARAPTEAAT